jgi:SAM-dependent methyltransferase
MILRILYRQRVKKWSTQFAEFGTAFEMGCGNGIMLETLRNLGWKVIGSERTVQTASIPHRQFGLPLFVGGLDALQPTSHFDLIFLFQVLEHLEDPVSTLQSLASTLKANGKMIVSVPNFSSWQSKYGQEKWFHLDIPRHLMHYSLASLKTLFTQIGMKIEDVSYTSLEHDPYGWIQSILNRVDPKFNRLTRLLMQLDRPDPINITHVIFGIILGVLCVPLAAISWLFRNGGLIEVTAVKLESNHTTALPG